MSVIIKRRTNWIGMALPVSIIVDGKKVGKAYFDEEFEIDINDESAELVASQMSGRSNRVVIRDGDSVIIKTSAWSQISLYLFFFLLALIMIIIQPFMYKSIALALLLAVFLISSFTLKQFEITVTN